MVAIGGQIIPASATSDSTSFAVTATVAEQCAIVVRARLDAIAPRCSSGVDVALASLATVTMTQDAAGDRTILTFTF